VPEGIAVRKGDTSMLDAMQAAFHAVKADGTYDNLFTKWQLNAGQKIGIG
jgi:ABC-type amino acid transport substrate-binding protein